MTEEEIINGLQDLILDRESFITEEDSIFIQDKKVLEEAIELIQKQQEEIENIKQYWQWSLEDLQDYHKIASDLKYECTGLIYKLEEKDKIIDRIYDFIWKNDCCRYFSKKHTMCNQVLNFDSCLGNCKRHCIQKYFEKAED